ncbi:putative glyoxalase superfamily protein PhnB [Herbihabitans rhizosphaerae]|uniref:Putative glyoxalase superfamily protein PhnB n=1 Tax=Herbihabitans rhizosphaerae TaxID=1872711 RepID=A0A4Q7KFY8_9PSEU|nr:VOC family protein [Herbihabitans rhizosphaerae]RZS32802.1 putative glyoxalase superfamily protein PhnB [Herbihabitans rhizosphaerae]
MSPPRPHALSPHLFVRDVEGSISFYRKAFGAVELFRNVLPDGTILFVELAVGGGRLLVSEESPARRALSPASIGGSPMLLLLELDDVDDTARRAIFAGATVEMEVQEMFFGERYGIVVDPSGHRWALSTRREQYTPDDIVRHTPPDA